MSTLLSRIFGRGKKAEAPQTSSDSLDIRALKPLMSPSDFAATKYRTEPPVSLDPKDLSGAWRMGQVLEVFPSAQRGLFQRFHIGGCNSCGYEPSDTLGNVASSHGLSTEEVVAFIKESGQTETQMEISVDETATLLKKGAIKLVDVRQEWEFATAHIEGSVLGDQALLQEIMQQWPKDTPIVTVCHHGVRSLDAAAYLRGHGLTNVRSMRGGIDVWSTEVDPKVPRY